MSIKNLVPRFGRHRDSLPVRRDEASPFRDFQREMNSLFDDFFGEAPLSLLDDRLDIESTAFIPRVDISETDQEVNISAELPGLDEKDITVEMQDDILFLRGEKKSDHEEKRKNWFRREQTYGSFHRAIPLPGGVDTAKATAQFKKGVLTVTAPKCEKESESRNTIPIQTE